MEIRYKNFGKLTKNQISRFKKISPTKKKAKNERIDTNIEYFQGCVKVTFRELTSTLQRKLKISEKCNWIIHFVFLFNLYSTRLHLQNKTCTIYSTDKFSNTTNS